MAARKISGTSFIVPALLGTFVLVFSLWALWLGDDFYNGPGIFSWHDIVNSQIHHYTSVNGRAVAYFFCQLYIPFFGKTIFAISNALVCVGLLLIMDMRL